MPEGIRESWIAFSARKEVNKKKMETEDNQLIQDEIEDELSRDKWAFIKTNAFVNSLMVFVVFAALMLYMYPAAHDNLLFIVQGITKFDLKTLFNISFLAAFFLGMFTMLNLFYCGNINVKIVLAKLLKRKMVFMKNSDSIYDLKIVKEVKDGKYHVKGYGGFEVVKDAIGWLANGIMIMPVLDNYHRGISFKEVRDNSDIIIDPTPYQDHVEAVKVCERNKLKQGFFSPQVMMPFVMLIMVIGIAGYLIMGAIDNSTCQGRLVEMTGRLQAAGLNPNPVANQTETNQKLPMGLDVVQKSMEINK